MFGVCFFTGIMFVLGMPSWSHGDGSITGRVRRATSLAPLQFVEVLAENQDDFSTYSSSSESDGSYQIDVPAGYYTVKATAPYTTNLTSQWYPGINAAPWDWYPDGYDTVEVLDGNDTAVNFLLSAGAVLSGVITNSSGDPVVSAEVTIGRSNSFNWAINYTDGDGRFLFDQLPAGSYHLHVSPVDTYIPEWYNNLQEPFQYYVPDGATPIVLSAGQIFTNFSMGLDTGGTISGRVTNNNGSAISFIEVSARDSNYNVYFTFADVDGYYEITGLVPATYYVRTYAQTFGLNYIDEWYPNVRASSDELLGTPLDVFADQVVSNINLGLDPGAVLEVTVLPEGAYDPEENIAISLYNHEFQEAYQLSTSFPDLVSIVGQPSGDYTVKAQGGNLIAINRLAEWYEDIPASPFQEFPPGGVKPVTLIEGATNRITMILGEGGMITGTAFTTNGTPVDYFEVLAYPKYPSEIVGPAEIVSSGFALGENGEYKLGGLIPGVHYIVARQDYESQNLVSLWYSNIPAAHVTGLTGTPFLVKAGQVITNINFILYPGGIIEGAVTTSGMSPSPLSDVYIEVYSKTNLQSVGQTYTDFDGLYSIGGFPPGNYYVRTDGGDQYGRRDEWFDNVGVTSSIPPASSIAVTVFPEVVTGSINFPLNNESVINGNIKTNGVNCDDCLAFVYNMQGEYLDSVFTDGSGNFSVTGLSGGRYYVRAISFSNFRSEWFSNVAVTGDNVSVGASLIIVGIGGTSNNINFSLEFGGCVTGRVMSASGSPLPGVFVEAVNAKGEYLQSEITDSGGYYRIGGLHAMAVKLRISYPPLGYLPQWYSNVLLTATSVPAQASNVVVSLGTCTGPANFVLTQAYPDLDTLSITGTTWTTTWSGSYDRVYQVQVSSNLVHWRDAPVGMTMDEQIIRRAYEQGIMQYQSPDSPTNSDALFQRVRIID